MTEFKLQYTNGKVTVLLNKKKNKHTKYKIRKGKLAHTNYYGE